MHGTSNTILSIYKLAKTYGFTGLEIAPTKIFPKCPYNKLDAASAWSKNLKKNYGLSISPMQSIWFGRQEKLFGTDAERMILSDYSKKTIDFASAVGCNNLVFGCPKNRNIPKDANPIIAQDFFRELGNYADKNGTVIGLEANPPIYNTNYINDTPSAIKLISKIDSNGLLLNLDVGTMIENNESAIGLAGHVHLINHVHISEPYLKPIIPRNLHQELKSVLQNEGYNGFISIEMNNIENVLLLENIMEYIKDYAVLIPIINEGTRIITELERAYKHEIYNYADIIICDGNSTDGCTEGYKLRKLNVNTLLVKKDSGKQGAQLRMGIWWALQRGYRGIITIDGNNKDSIEDIPRFVEKLNEGYDFIQGSCFIKGGNHTHTTYKITIYSPYPRPDHIINGSALFY